jgi:hypothetical protein
MAEGWLVTSHRGPLEQDIDPLKPRMAHVVALAQTTCVGPSKPTGSFEDVQLRPPSIVTSTDDSPCGPSD